MTDDLTGLHNLRSFEARLASLVAAARENRSELSILVLDLDRLKQLNDVHGHLAGADAVRTVGHILADRLPSEAVACRYGGDEFVIAVPGCGAPRVEELANDLRTAVNSVAPVLAGKNRETGTLSISIARNRNVARVSAGFKPGRTSVPCRRPSALSCEGSRT